MKSQMRWLVSPLFDGFWFIASPLVAVSFYYIYVLTGPSLESTFNTSAIFLFFLLFTGLFDAPHIFSTFARTHLDPIERKRHFLFHGFTLMAALVVSLVSSALHWEQVFMVLLGLYGSWHIVRQNIGFVRMYQRMNFHLESSSPGQEVNLLLASLPFYYLHGHSDLEEVFSSAMPAVFILQRISELVLAVLLVQVLWSNYQVRKSRGSWNTPKMLLVFSSLALVLWLAILEVHPLLLIALSTIGHDLQYQAWMWVYNKRSPQKARKPLAALAACMVIGVVIAVGPEQWAPLYNGFVLWHYFIDGHIWHFGSSPELVSIFKPIEDTISV